MLQFSGVITYGTNENTSAVIKHLVSPTEGSDVPPRLRILLETDAPYMVPNNIYKSIPGLKSGSRMPLCHTAMLPWTAEFVANVAKEAGADYDAERVMREANENAVLMYGLGDRL